MTDKIILDKFRFFGGRHCQSSSLKNMFVFHGLNLSEEMMLGLGGGIGFIYWYSKNMPAPFVGMRNSNIVEFVEKICQRTGGSACLWRSKSSKKSYEKLKNILSSGEPVYVFVDMAFLPYLALPSNAHFGGHSVVVFGIDEEKDIVYISDRGKTYFTVSVEDFKNARCSEFPPFPARNGLMEIKYPKKIKDLENGINQGIKESCETMFNPPISNFGLKGIKKWAEIVTEWDSRFKGENLLGCLLNTFIYIEIGGTGGRGFRSMYSKFLTESADILREPQLKVSAEMFEKSARKLSEVASAALPDGIYPLKKIRELFIEKNKLFEEAGAESFSKLQNINIKIDCLMKDAMEYLKKNDAAPLLFNLREKILNWHQTEEDAFENLHSII